MNSAATGFTFECFSYTYFIWFKSIKEEPRRKAMISIRKAIWQYKPMFYLAIHKINHQNNKQIIGVKCFIWVFG